MCAQGIQGVGPALAAVAVMQGTEARFDPVQVGTYYVFALGKSAADLVVSWSPSGMSTGDSGRRR
jgi:hypothetical protein